MTSRPPCCRVLFARCQLKGYKSNYATRLAMLCVWGKTMLTYCNSIVFWQLDFVSCNHAIRNGFTLFYISLLMVLLEVLCDFWWGWLCPFDNSLLFSFNHLLYISVILSDTCMMLIRLILYQNAYMFYVVHLKLRHFLCRQWTFHVI